MKTAMKRIFSLMLVAVLLVSVFPMTAMAAPNRPGQSKPSPKNCEVCGEKEPCDCWTCPTCKGKYMKDAPCSICTADTPDPNQPGDLENPDVNNPEGPAIPENPTDEPNDEPNDEPDVVIPATKALLKQGSQETPRTENRPADWSATVEAILIHWFDGDPAQFSNAYIYRNDGSKGTVGLSDLVTAGDEIHIRLKEVTPAPETCSVCGEEKSICPVTCPGNANYTPCKECWVDPCICCDKCNGTTIEHDRKCPLNEREDTKGKVTLTLDYNYKGSHDTKMDVDHNAKIIDIIAGIPAPTRDDHLFSHWTMDAAGEDLIDTERVTDKGVVIYAQWDDDLAIGGKITIKVNLNYDRKMADPVTNITKGTRMGDILDYISIPSRWNHKFVGWYWDRNCTDPVEAGDKVYRNDEIFAKWEHRKTNNEIMLKIYLNGDTKSVAKIVDMYDYAKDGEISMSEVKEVVKKYYTAKNSDGMSFIGLFEAKTWSDFVGNRKHNNGSNHIDVNRHDDTTIFVMVHNAKTYTTSSGTADTSNPKTGDMIMTPVIVLGASAACLATLFYLNKKRAV